MFFSTSANKLNRKAPLGLTCPYNACAPFQFLLEGKHCTTHMTIIIACALCLLLMTKYILSTCGRSYINHIQVSLSNHTLLHGPGQTLTLCTCNMMHACCLIPIMHALQFTVTEIHACGQLSHHVLLLGLQIVHKLSYNHFPSNCLALWTECDSSDIYRQGCHASIY